MAVGKYQPFLINAGRYRGRSWHVERERIHLLACISLHMTVSEPRALEAGEPRRLRRDRPRQNAREPPGMSPAARALRSDVVRRAASRGGTLRCAEARRVAYRDVDKSYASHRLG
jgi:hypothetical protein